VKKPAAFMSYAHRDDRSGRLSKLRERLSEEVGVQTGEDFEIFQDRDAILWGQHWRERIEESLDAVTFLIAIITPSFFRSPHCRNELKRFIDREERLARKDLILPIHYVDTPLLTDEAKRATDEQAQLIATRQYVDWRELRNKPFKSPRVNDRLEQLAAQIRDALDRVREEEERSLESARAGISDTKEAILERQEQAAREKERQQRLEKGYKPGSGGGGSDWGYDPTASGGGNEF
jgi:cobaltochelatase CobT